MVVFGCEEPAGADSWRDVLSEEPQRVHEENESSEVRMYYEHLEIKHVPVGCH